jgi:Domain of unknown function (DUF5680)
MGCRSDNQNLLCSFFVLYKLKQKCNWRMLSLEDGMFDTTLLQDFIVVAKSNTYVADGTVLFPCRAGSHDIGYESGKWRYLDSYFGGSDFAGQEVVWFAGEPVWAMNYFGRIIQPGLIDAAKAGRVIKAALMHMYVDQKRFLGGLEFSHAFGHYTDQNRGAFDNFSGQERIVVDGLTAYELDYRGGLVVP